MRHRRRMPHLSDCEMYWGVPPSTCARCREVARCERAHVIDRCFGGLDGVQNVVPLCVRCHKQMPPHFPGEEARALAWLAQPDLDRWPISIVQAYLEQYPEECAEAERRDTAAAARAIYDLPLDFTRLPHLTPAEF